jgi:hypothetical protein
MAALIRILESARHRLACRLGIERICNHRFVSGECLEPALVLRRCHAEFSSAEI